MLFILPSHTKPEAELSSLLITNYALIYCGIVATVSPHVALWCVFLLKAV